MDKLAEKSIQCHKNPLVKLDLQGLKLFIPSNSTVELEHVNKSLDVLKKALDVVRVERRCGRSKCIWHSGERLVQVLKIVGALSHFGYRNKNGYFLLPNEALFLLEVNRIEMLWNDIPISLEQAYSVILKNLADMQNYRVYRKLTLAGFQVRRLDTSRKRKRAEEIETSSKIQRLSSESETSAHLQASTSTESVNHVLRDSPKQISDGVSVKPDYTVHTLSNKTSQAEFNLYIAKSPTIHECLNISEKDVPNITAFTFPDSVVFYRFSTISLPVL